MTSKSRTRTLKLPRGRPPLPGSDKYEEYMKIKQQILDMRTPQDIVGGLPVVRRGRPPVSKTARARWDAQQQAAKAVKALGAIRSSKTPLARIAAAVDIPEETESDAQILARHIKSFQMLHDLTGSVAKGRMPALIVAGGAGIGKTYTVEDVLNSYKTKNKLRFEQINGKITAIELYEHFYSYSAPTDVTLLDDADSLYFNEDSLNVLKGALDSKRRRTISWRSRAPMDVPSKFVFEGSAVFITNLDMARIVMSASRLSDHLKAVMNRAVYFDLKLHTPRELAIWVDHVCRTKGILQTEKGLSNAQMDMVLKWINDNKYKMREISLRSALHIGTFVSDHTKDWQEFAERALFGQAPEL